MQTILVNLLSIFSSNTCSEHVFFRMPTWYKYLLLDGKMAVNPATNRCEVASNLGVGDLALIAVAGVDILLRLAALVAVGYVIYGGIQFITAQGEPDKVKTARQTAINALIGLAIALIATGLITFIGTQLG